MILTTTTSSRFCFLAPQLNHSPLTYSATRLTTHSQLPCSTTHSITHSITIKLLPNSSHNSFSASLLQNSLHNSFTHSLTINVLNSPHNSFSTFFIPQLTQSPLTYSTGLTTHFQLPCSTTHLLTNHQLYLNLPHTHFQFLLHYN